MQTTDRHEMIHHMKRFIGPLAVLVALAIPGIAGATSWKIVKKKSVSGQYAVIATGFTVNNPRQLAVDFIGGGGDVVWECENRFSDSSWTKSYGAGLHKLANTSGKSSCDVTASINGPGHLTIEILMAK